VTAYSGKLPGSGLARKAPSSLSDGATFGATALQCRTLPGWAADDHAAAFRAFLLSRPVLSASRNATLWAQAIAASQDVDPNSSDAARTFFETWFRAWPVAGTKDAASSAFFTGYFEPVLEGARTRHGRYQVPIYRKPQDLEPIVDDRLRGALGAHLTYGRRRANGHFEPFETRAQIEAGALQGLGLELMFLYDPVAVYTLHVQGSGQVRLDTGQTVRVGYAAKNGHPYASIGQYLISTGEIAEQDMTLQALEAWLRAHPDRAGSVMQHNPSFIFFTEQPADRTGPVGVAGIPLVAGRSLAVDAAEHQIGAPVFVNCPGSGREDATGLAVQRVMIAHDVGSGVRGAGRGDIFYGSGEAAANAAGATRHHGELFALLPCGISPCDVRSGVV